MELYVHTNEPTMDALLTAALSLWETTIPVLRTTGTVYVTTDTTLTPETMPAAELVIVYCTGEGRSVSGLSEESVPVLTLPVPVSLPVLERALIGLTHKSIHEPATTVPQETTLLTLVPGENLVQVGDDSVRLTEREFALLSVLVKHRGQLVPKEELKKTVWTEETTGNVCEVHMAHLRQKLSALLGNGILVSVRGKGYILRDGL